MDYNSNELVNKIDGIEENLINVLSKCLNFTYKLIDCHQNWGKKLANNSWTGVIGRVYEKVYKFNKFYSIKSNNK